VLHRDPHPRYPQSCCPTLVGTGLLVAGQCFLALGKARLLSFLIVTQTLILFTMLPLMFGLFGMHGAIYVIALFPVLSGLWEYYIVRAEIETAHDIALQLESIGTKQTDPRIEENMYRTSRRMMGSTLFWQGRLIEANAYLQPHDSQIPQTSASLKAIQAYSQDSEVARLANLACVTWLMGNPSKAINIAKQAINRATKLEHPFSIAYALNFAAIVYQLCGNTEELIKTARQLVKKSRTYDFNFWHKLGLLLCSWADINNEIDAKSIDRFWIHIRQYNDAGCYLASTYFKTLLIQAYIDVKDHDHALQLVNEYFDSKDDQKESVFKADFYRLWAKILLSSSRNNAVAAEESLLSAIKVSRNQGAKALELRATCDYCVLLKDLNRTEEARKILVMLFDQYSAQDHVDMKPFPDWIMAKQILCELESRLNQGDLAGK